MEIDKTAKIGIPKVGEVIGVHFGEGTAKITTDFLSDPNTFAKKYFQDDETATNGSQETKKILDMAVDMGVERDHCEIDYSLARGLSYYTGPIFEAVLTDAPEIGSVFGGGRYDDLVRGFTGQKLPAVGASLGVDRLLAALERLEQGQEPTNEGILIFNLDETLAPDYVQFVRALREKGIPASTYLGEDRAFQAQLSYAVKKNLAFVVIYGPDEAKKGVVQIKNLQTREQKEVPKEKLLEFFADDQKSPPG